MPVSASLSPEIATKFDAYPEEIKTRLLYLRNLIFTTAAATVPDGEVVETLKWGQLSYMTKTGSTLRIDRHRDRPGYYAMYFHCRTRLVDTFKVLYRDQFEFEGNRAILLNVDAAIPVGELKHCIALALNYHRLKHLPMLGV